MPAKLLYNTPLWVCAHAVRTCWQSHGLSDTEMEHNDPHTRITGEKDKELILKVGNKFKHASTLEHLNYTFYLDGISRALLQELARHRIASLSVKSTRYTLKELKEENPFAFTLEDTSVVLNRASQYLVMTGNEDVDMASVLALENLRRLVAQGIPNDTTKFCLPDAYKTELTWTINARSLQNFLKLRTDKAAMWEIRRLAYDIYAVLPYDHQYLFEEFIYQESE